jgi:hypothetical protein
MNGRMFIKKELEIILKEMAVAYLYEPFHYFSGGTDEDIDRIKSG